MTQTPLRLAGALALTTALAFSAAACGSGDKKAACNDLQSTIQETTRTGMTQISDPNALAQTYTNAAAKMRQQGKDSGDGGVKKAADHAASAMEQLAADMKQTAAGSPKMPDSTPLINAGKELKQACG
ncbi:hypothetical protein NE235_36930 [Actinoallomurus spadix]|uniref:Small secreted protein n=1 Tax=Actinoallomurus spadix TaxID=79912 RepID=A0ABP3HDX7_9ACTN|nr:hypothetical protein [Actinoallomurus spadix]MCO5991711.1 hypothetical protein [Actinoallomurus spadix]